MGVVRFAAQALKRSKADPDPAKLVEVRAAIRDAMETTENFICGSMGMFTMSPDDHNGIHKGTGLCIMKWVGGKFYYVSR